MRIVYAVSGSEDGLMAVFGSVSKALKHAFEYTESEPTKQSQSDAREMRKGFLCGMLIDGDSCTAEIAAFGVE